MIGMEISPTGAAVGLRLKAGPNLTLGSFGPRAFLSVLCAFLCVLREPLDCASKRST